MAFPQTPLELTTELNLNGTWTDVTSYTYSRDGYAITRGRRSEGSTSDASTCTLTFDNRDGRFSPRNPLGAYYGTIGRNTRLRVSIPAASSYLDIPDSSTGGNYVSCPDHARLDITGDIDIRIDAWFATIPGDSGYDLIGKYLVTGNQRGYTLRMDPGGYPALYWSNDGTAVHSVDSNYPVPAPISGRRAIRATLDVDNGSGGYTVTFYYSDTISGSWTQLDQTVTTSGTTSIFNNTSALFVGDINGSSTFYTSQPWLRVYAAQVLDGIGGTAAANPDFTAQTHADTSFADAAGNTWTVGGSATIVGRDYRFHGEVVEWPTKWDVSGSDVYSPVTASGILRRLGTGSKPLKSAYYRACTSTVAPLTSLKAYWPCEDAETATSVASGLPGGQAMSVSGSPVFASDADSFPCSSALPNMGNASFTGNVPAYASTGQFQVRMLLSVPGAGTTNNAVLMSVRCGGTAARWDLVYQTGGSLVLNAYNSIGTSLLSTAPIAFNVDGVPIGVGLSLAQNGADVDYTISTVQLGTMGLYDSATLAGNTVTAARSVTVAASNSLAGVTIGHITVQSTVTDIFELSQPANAYDGESAVDRFLRLCGEEGITRVALGDDDGSVLMGPQTQKTILELLRECEAADGGILFEPREFFGLGYRSLRSTMSQDAVLTLDYSANDLSPDFEPIEDDRHIANDVTVSRRTGSSYRYTVATGALSTQDPPNGVGLYDTSVELNLYSDEKLGEAASWRAHIGTVDLPRFRSIRADLARANFTGDAALAASVRKQDVGDRIVVTNPPAWMPPEDISQLVIGQNENLNSFQHVIESIGVPENPYHVAIANDAGSRYSSDGSTVNGLHTTPITSLSVATASGPLWSHDDGDFDITVSGCQFTVTAVSGATSPQTFTVSLQNGITKNIPSGSEVTLFDPVYYC